MKPRPARRAGLRIVGAIVSASLMALFSGMSGSGMPTASAAGTRPADGVTPLPKYRWLEPPPFFAAGNETPGSARAAIPLRATGSAPSSIVTPDAQVVLTLGTDAIAPRGEDRRVRVTIEPVAASSAPPLATGLRANGNAYRITMGYEPSGTAVTALVKPGTLILAVPELNTQLMRSAGASRWAPVDARSLPPRNLSLSAAFERPGTYLSATNLPELAGPAPSRDHTAAIVAGVVAVLLVAAGGFVLRRRRSARSVRGSD